MEKLMASAASFVRFYRKVPEPDGEAIVRKAREAHHPPETRRTHVCCENALA
jgi:hypothetical protein